MAATIEWNIACLERETSDNYVSTVHWTATATDGELSAGAYGSIGLERPLTLIPYEELTKEVVLGWLFEKLGSEQKQAAEDALLAQIAEQKAPSKASGVPWEISSGYAGDEVQENNGL